MTIRVLLNLGSIYIYIYDDHIIEKHYFHVLLLSAAIMCHIFCDAIFKDEMNNYY